MLFMGYRVASNTSTTGTGSFTLTTAESGFRSFAAAGASNGSVIPYVAERGAQWERGFGIYNSTGPTITRVPVESSNANNLVNFTTAPVVFASLMSDFNNYARRPLRQFLSTGPSFPLNICAPRTLVGTESTGSTTNPYRHFAAYTTSTTAGNTVGVSYGNVAFLFANSSIPTGYITETAFGLNGASSNSAVRVFVGYGSNGLFAVSSSVGTTQSQPSAGFFFDTSQSHTTFRLATRLAGGAWNTFVDTGVPVEAANSFYRAIFINRPYRDDMITILMKTTGTPSSYIGIANTTHYTANSTVDFALGICTLDTTAKTLAAYSMFNDILVG